LRGAAACALAGLELALAAAGLVLATVVLRAVAFALAAAACRALGLAAGLAFALGLAGAFRAGALRAAVALVAAGFFDLPALAAGFLAGIFTPVPDPGKRRIIAIAEGQSSSHSGGAGLSGLPGGLAGRLRAA